MKDNVNTNVNQEDVNKQNEVHEVEPKNKRNKKNRNDKQLEELTEKYDELNDKYLRLFSEFDNYRKRTEREKGESGAMLVYCFPQKRESLWSIAKLYRVSPEEIRNANPDSFDDSGISASESPILIKP